MEIWITSARHLALRRGVEAIAFARHRAGVADGGAGERRADDQVSSRPIAACSAPPTRTKEKTPVSTEPASQRSDTTPPSGGPLRDCACRGVLVAEVDEAGDGDVSGQIPNPRPPSSLAKQCFPLRPRDFEPHRDEEDRSGLLLSMMAAEKVGAAEPKSALRGAAVAEPARCRGRKFMAGGF